MKDLDYKKLIKLISSTLPHSIDVDVNGDFVPADKDYGEKGYLEDIECFLEITLVPKFGSISIQYVGEDDRVFWIESEDKNYDFAINNDTTQLDLELAFTRRFGYIGFFEHTLEELNNIK